MKVSGYRRVQASLYTGSMIIKSWKQSVCIGLGMAWGLAAAVHAESSPLPEMTEASERAFECESLLTVSHARGSLQLLKVWLHSQGMHLVLQGCPFVRVAEAQMAQVLPWLLIWYRSCSGSAVSTASTSACLEVVRRTMLP